MNFKSKLQFALSVVILVFLLSLVVLWVAVSAGFLDMSPDPVVEANENTTGVPKVNASANPGIDGRELEMEIFQQVNEQRVIHGSDPLVHSERVRLISRLHSFDMGTRGFFNHTNPDGLTPPDRHDEYDGCKRPNENIGKWPSIPTNDTEKIASEVVSGWMNSSGHNASMMTSYDKVSGIGVYVTENGTLYVTQNFCREHPNA